MRANKERHVADSEASAVRSRPRGMCWSDLSSARSQHSVRCRTDGKREDGQAVAQSRGALHGHAGCALQGVARLRDRAGTARRCRRPTLKAKNFEEVNSMLYTIAVVLLILWFLGLVTSYTIGGFIHVLLVVAVVMILVNLISGRRAL